MITFQQRPPVNIASMNTETMPKSANMTISLKALQFDLVSSHIESNILNYVIINYKKKVPTKITFASEDS